MFKKIKQLFGWYGKCPKCNENLDYKLECTQTKLYDVEHFFNYVSWADNKYVRIRRTQLPEEPYRTIECIFSDKIWTMTFNSSWHGQLLQLYLPNDKSLIWLPEKEFQEKLKQYISLL